VAIITFSAIYYVVTTTLLCIRRKRQNRGAPAGNLPPVTLLRPVKRGVPNLEARLHELVASVRAGDQILVGIDDPDSLAIAEKIPGLEIVHCRPGPMLNRKVSKLAQMTPSARNPHWIISDSESIFSREFLDGFRADWQRGDAVTAGYVFHGARNVPELLDHIAAILTLWPGLMLAPRRFTLGACTGLLQRDLEAIGGWEAIGSHLAEDNQLGTLLTGAGKRIIFSRWVLPLDGDRMGLGSYLRHQLRIAVTYRVSTPAGYFGMVLTHGVTASLLLLLCTLGAPWAMILFLAIWLLRTATAEINARALGFPVAGLAFLALAHSLVESGCWLASWFSGSVQWNGSDLRVNHQGVIEADAPPVLSDVR